MRGGASMDEKKSELTITFIDKERRAAYMEYNGCSITLNFSKERNPEIQASYSEVMFQCKNEKSCSLSKKVA
jgi:hypothetical protein